MKYKILFSATVCLMLLRSTTTTAQSNKVSAKELLAHMDSIKAAKQNNKHLKQSTPGNLREQSFEVFHKIADPNNVAQPKLIVNSIILNKLKLLDEKEPYHFFSEATSEYEFKNDRYDYAAVIFYVGLIRYKYFMGVNPEYAPGDGWITCESMKQSYEKRIELYLQSNIDKYIATLKFATEYCSKYSYGYWKKPVNQIQLQKAIEPYKTLLKDLETNRQKYLNQWQEDRTKNLSSDK